MTDKKQSNVKSDKQDTQTKGASGNAEDNSRRKTLRNILAATGILAGAQVVPSKWSKPIVDTVMLPAHAQGTS